MNARLTLSWWVYGELLVILSGSGKKHNVHLLDQNKLKLMLPSRMMMRWRLCETWRWHDHHVLCWDGVGLEGALEYRLYKILDDEQSCQWLCLFLMSSMRAYFFDPKPKNKSILWKDYLEPINPEEGEWDTGEGEKAKNNDNRSDRRVVLLLMMMVMLMMTMIMLTLMRTLTMPSWCI